MTHGVPWGVLNESPLREGLVTLTERMDLDVSGGRASRAYVALRMISTLFGRALNKKDLEVNLSREGTVALVEELTTIPQLQGLREALLITLHEEPEDEGQRTERHHREAVRRSRSFSFQR